MEKETKITCFGCNEVFKIDQVSEQNDNFYCEHCIETLFFECADCHKLIDNDDKHETREGDVCEICFTENYYTCEHCDEAFSCDDSYFSDSYNIYCESCYYDNYFTCSGCDSIYHSDDSNYCEHCDTNFCSSCYDNHECEGNDEERRVLQNNEQAYIDTKKGRIIKSKRKFGVEVEFLYPNNEAINAIFAKLPVEFGITDDGSIDGLGKEVQSPILGGKKGEQAVKTLTKVLKEQGCQVNASCGYHLHLDATEFAKDFTKLKNLLLFYHLFEEKLMKVLPASRRNNKFCQKLCRLFTFKQLKDIKNGEELDRKLYETIDVRRIEIYKREKYNPSRYYGVNIHSLFYRGTIEIRFHSGTIDATKILEWANLHQTILDLVASGKINEKILNHSIMERLTFEKYLKLLKLSEPSRNYWNNRIKTLCVE